LLTCAHGKYARTAQTDRAGARPVSLPNDKRSREQSR
jgi:hypothetical protein